MNEKRIRMSGGKMHCSCWVLRGCRSSLVLLLLVAVAAAADPSSSVQFNRDIRPILSDKCFRCHGPDAMVRAADLRLDQRADAITDRGDGAAIVPGEDDESTLIARVSSADVDMRMPPESAGEPLSAHEIKLLRSWIRQGASYQKHWSFEPLVKPRPPRSNSADSANPIDAFVAGQLAQRGLRLAPRASLETLLRRVTLDLTGLPPTVEELQAFRTELRTSGQAVCFERVVDRLLGSIHFGEHLAIGWLDAARYADTNGYFGDRPRQMWIWRDWVVNAFNANLPFDEFTVQQLAGDLLPAPTLDQRIATGFNRNHMANNESGIIDEEFRLEYVVDRVSTTMTTWLGISAGCAQCHDHKYDPISQREFYQLFAFFNNIPESGLIREENPPPVIEVPSAAQRRRLTALTLEDREARDAFQSLEGDLRSEIASWEAETAHQAVPVPLQTGLQFHETFDGSLSASTTELGTALVFEAGVRDRAAKFDGTRHAEVNLKQFNADGPWTIGVWLNASGSLSCPWSIIEPMGNRRGIEMIWQKGRLSVHLVNRWGASLITVSTLEPLSAKGWHHVVVSYDGMRKASGLRVYVDGLLAAVDPKRDTLAGSVSTTEPLRIGRRDSGLGFYGLLDELKVVRGTLDERAIRDWFWGERIRGILARDPAERNSDEAETLLDYYVDHFAQPSALARRQRVRAAVRGLAELKESIPTVLVMQEMEQPRVTYLFDRGQYDKPGDVVLPGVPGAIAPWPQGSPPNRLGFAQWLVADENPLTPRVAANRLWQHCFGTGLVRTVDDFGSQGALPTHPELLDWLAASFRESGWDVKWLLRLIVTSRTYQQQSHFRQIDTLAADADNRWLARGPSCRLSAEMLRDQALSVAGLLVTRTGGPSVKPYQPPGLWEAVSYNGEESYLPDTGEGLWRRSLYTYIKRQSPPPGLLTFDGPTREKCTMDRMLTNTPLQALLLLNDETYIEAARELAARVLRPVGPDEQRLRRLWQRVLLRTASATEIDRLFGLLERQRRRFAADQEAARQLLSVGALRVDESIDPLELAAWTVVAQALLNLDEAITKR